MDCINCVIAHVTQYMLLQSTCKTPNRVQSILDYNVSVAHSTGARIEHTRYRKLKAGQTIDSESYKAGQTLFNTYQSARAHACK